MELTAEQNKFRSVDIKSNRLVPWPAHLPQRPKSPTIHHQPRSRFLSRRERSASPHNPRPIQRPSSYRSRSPRNRLSHSHDHRPFEQSSRHRSRSPRRGTDGPKPRFRSPKHEPFHIAPAPRLTLTGPQVVPQIKLPLPPQSTRILDTPLSPEDFDALLSETSIEETLALYYGFKPPPAYAHSLPDLDTDHRDVLKGTLGVFDVRCYEESPLAPVARRFLNDLAQGIPPDVRVYDLSTSHASQVSQTPRFSCMYLVSKGFIVFDFGSQATVPWKLAVRNGLDALYVCRLDPRYDEQALVRQLALEGIRFNTLLSLPVSPRLTPYSSTTTHHQFPPSYQFTQQDFELYVQNRTIVLSGPRGRAALMHGGIIWRLALEDVKLETVLAGPSMHTVSHQNGLCIPNTVQVVADGNHFCDDELTEDEIHIICGVYTCSTGQGAQTSTKSWWPLPSTFDSGGRSYGRWTEQNEAWYQKRLKEIGEGHQPIGQKGWRNHLRGLTYTRNFQANVLRLADSLVTSARS